MKSLTTTILFCGCGTITKMLLDTHNYELMKKTKVPIIRHKPKIMNMTPIDHNTQIQIPMKLSFILFFINLVGQKVE